MPDRRETLAEWKEERGREEGGREGEAGGKGIKERKGVKGKEGQRRALRKSREDSERNAVPLPLSSPAPQFTNSVLTQNLFIFALPRGKDRISLNTSQWEYLILCF